MLFNSYIFLLFVVIVFLIYWSLNTSTLKIQNSIILISSYVFYGWWDWRFLSLIIFSSSLDYWAAIKIENAASKTEKKQFLLISVFLNLALLGFFKYYNFFVDSLILVFSKTGLDLSNAHLNIILPVGISFYTFQTMSYTIDVYKNKIQASRDYINFLAYVSFFPQLVAGPIERAKNLLPQFSKRRNFDYQVAMEGFERIIWGLFKKIVIADNAGYFVDNIFSNYFELNPLTLILGAVYFCIQVYCDFSGYSDMAIGLASLFGFKLMNNFNYPFFATNYSELWGRWHISLTTWFRDYVYYPLVGSSTNVYRRVATFILVFVISGLWHGANWTFIVWGFANALFSLPSFLRRKRRSGDESSNGLIDFVRRFGVFMTFSLLGIFFRAENLFHATQYFKSIFNWENIHKPIEHYMFSICLITFLSIEFWSKDNDYPMQKIKNNFAKYFCYVLLALCLFAFGTQSKEFVYFAF